MTYYEEAIVKKYKRKNNKDSTQINLGVNSKFKKNDKIIVIREDDFENLISNDDVDLKKELDELKAKFEETSSSKEEVENLKKKLLDEKDDKEKLLIKIAIQNENLNLLTEKENTIKNYEKEIETKDKIIDTLTNNWTWYKRIFNVLPKDIILNDSDKE